MTYRRLLLGRWSRRDKLAILVVSLGVAFLCGTALLIVVAGGQTSAIAAEYGATTTVTTHDTIDAAMAAAPLNASVLPFAVVTSSRGDRRYVLARPEEPVPTLGSLGPSNGATVGGIDTATDVRLAGERGSIVITVSPRESASIIPSHWYLANISTVRHLGPTGAFVVRPVPSDSVPRTGVPLRTALAFFVFGTREALAALGTAVIGSGLLIGVVIYSITRMTIRDRSDTIRVIRATGGRDRTLLALFGVRAGVLTATGAALGYAFGVIGVNAAINVAVFAGLPTSLSPTVTPAVATVLVPIVGSVILLGIVSGVGAAWQTTRRRPFGPVDRTPSRSADRRFVGRVHTSLTPTVIDVRTIVPTTATLTTFVVFVVLVSSMAGVITPLTAGDGATITQPGSPHPVASTVPVTYADALRAEGIDASPEILLFQVSDGRTYTVRAANYTAFTSVTDVSVLRGQAPASPNEAVIGADLSQTLGVERGDHITLGGSTRDGLARVEVVGVYRAPGPFDDHVIVPLATGRQLANKPDGTAQFVRADRLPNVSIGDDAITVVDIRAPERVAVNESFTAWITVENQRERAIDTTVAVSFDGQTLDRSVSIEPGEQTTIELVLSAGTAGKRALRAGDRSRSILVGNATADSGSLSIVPLPDRVPPNATLLLTVRDPNGDPVPNATVTVGNRTTRTGTDGVAAIPTGEPGSLDVRVTSGDRTGRAVTRVTDGVDRHPVGSVSLSPTTPDLLTRPTVTARLVNPWNRTVVVDTVELTGPDRSITRSVSIPPGGEETISTRLPQQPPGTYDISLRVDGVTIATERYRVTGDDRIAAALATDGRTGTSGIGRAIEAAFGNLQLVFGTVLVLAGALTVGGTTATFARAVHGRRRTIGIYRATGASPVRVTRIVLSDALSIGLCSVSIAVPLGLIGLRVADAFGYLTVFGIRLRPTGSPTVLLGAAVGGIVLTLLGAALATGSLLSMSPSRLVRDESGIAPPGERGGDYDDE
ncbi:FtsX-like permease family protein [Halobaculum sp. EA56]|uniref:FtsX-like permease family protein n=1 Tax=Halobaculum sp. EA56 TaxID=3421648 RepID=UPI003EC0DC36